MSHSEPVALEPTHPVRAGNSSPSHSSTSLLFLGAALLQVGATFILNRVVLTDAIHASAMGEAGGAALVESARRWETLSYLASPLLLLARIGLGALLVQLVLLASRATPPFGQIFRAGIWAQGSLLLGTLIQIGWLATLSAGSIGPATLSRIPGSLGAILPPLGVDPSPVLLLVHQTTIFDLGWILLFALALEDRQRVRLPRAFGAVGTAWGIIALAKWALLLLLTGMV